MYPPLKRIIDLLLGTIGFLLLSPLFLVVMVSLGVSNGGQPFFTQLRPGRGGRIFRIIKFKTMNDKRDAQGNLLPDADRLTRMVRLVRSTSLDELPQLINVIKGEMSLVGPRPLFVKYLDLYTPEQARRHEVRPGITGWAQVNGRNAISWEERFRLDVYYVDNYSLALDIKIIWLTLRKVIQREGISAAGNATMTEFLGTHQQPHR